MKKGQINPASASQAPDNLNRREFMHRTAAGMTGLALMKLAPGSLLADDQAGLVDPALPRALAVPGLHAYTREKSVAAGGTLDFCVSSTVPYELSICRLGQAVDDPSSDQVLHAFPRSLPRPQTIHPGSYILVDSGLPEALNSFALECWVRPRRNDVWSGLMGQYDYPNHCGYGLFLNPDGGVTFYFGQKGAYNVDNAHHSTKKIIQANQWHHIVANWDGDKAEIWVNGEKAGQWNWFGTGMRVMPGASPFRLGASAENGQANHLLDGDLAMPIVYKNHLTEHQIAGRYADRGLTSLRGREVHACWPLNEESGAHIKDLSEYQRHGRIINHGTWMIGGPSFDADVPRYGDYDPAQDIRRGHAIRLASDDLYDCRWVTSHQYHVPEDAKPGIYVGRFRYQWQGTEHLYHSTFIVRKNPKRKPAPILVLCASNTWLAYNGTPFGKNQSKLKQVWGTGGTENSEGEPPAFNMYRAHAAGQGTYQVGLRMPWPAAGPYILYGGPTEYSHLMRAERFTHVWLNQAGYEYDVISDLDLHRNPEQLKDYRAVVINGHSEYWSIPMYRGLESYLQGGGNLVCLSGNSLCWRVSFNEDGSVMESRKVDAPGNQAAQDHRGECWHSHDGRRGGLMRECGFPGWKLIGLDTLGWNNQGDPKQFGAYHVDRPDHFLFQKPFPVDVTQGDALGQGPNGSLPRANGHEIDVRPSTLRALQALPSPEGGVVPEDPTGMVRLANGTIPWSQGGAAFDYFFRQVKPATNQGAEMIYWERPDGGRVFNAGSIGSGWALSADPKFQKLLQNVLAHFGVRPSTRPMADRQDA